MTISSSILQQKQQLPIYQHVDRIVSSARRSHVVIMVGETGSGKTTQVPQYLIQHGLHRHQKRFVDKASRKSYGRGMIVVTQPRRVAAVTVAQRVAHEMNTTVGSKGLVGHSVRFDEQYGPSNAVKFATDGMLLREAQLDPLLRKYSVIILDEAHERTLQTDILFGVVLQALKVRNAHSSSSIDKVSICSNSVRDSHNTSSISSTTSNHQISNTDQNNAVSPQDYPPLRVIVMSATLDVAKFQTFFGDDSLEVECLHIPGRQHPVKIHYTNEAMSDYCDASVRTALQLHCDHSASKVQGWFDAIHAIERVLKRAARLLTKHFPTAPFSVSDLRGAVVHALRTAQETCTIADIKNPGDQSTKTTSSKSSSFDNLEFTSIASRNDTNTDAQGRIEPKYSGDILIFLPGQDDIENIRSTLQQQFVQMNANFQARLYEYLANMCERIGSLTPIQNRTDDTSFTGNNRINITGSKLYAQARTKLPDILQQAIELLPDVPSLPSIQIVPLYAAMPADAQLKAFAPAPPGQRKIILATNIAETSVTIAGVTYVIDPGYVKVRFYDPRTGVESLRPIPVSQAQAWQRAGRAGREGPGECYRLYTEEVYRQLVPQPIPEIRRVLLSEVLLTLLDMGIPAPAVQSFPFLDPPSTSAIRRAMMQLLDLGAVNIHGTKLSEQTTSCNTLQANTPYVSNHSHLNHTLNNQKHTVEHGNPNLSMEKPQTNDRYYASSAWLTRTGQQLAALPVPPLLAMIVLQSEKLGCTVEALTLVSLMSVDNVFVVPRNAETAARAKHARFASFEGDHWTFITVFRAYESIIHSVATQSSMNEYATNATNTILDTMKTNEIMENRLSNRISTNTVMSLPSLTKDQQKQVDDWCRRHYIHSRNLRTAAMIREQLASLVFDDSTGSHGKNLKHVSLPVRSCKNDTSPLRKAVAAGAFLHIAKRVPSAPGRGTRPVYITLIDHRQVTIHPHSVLYSRSPHPDWVVYSEIVTTTKPYMRHVTRIEPEWLPDLVPQHFRLREKSA